MNFSHPLSLFKLAIPLFALLFMATSVGGATIRSPSYKPNTPPSSSAKYQQGVAALARGNFNTAKKAFQATLEQTPSHVGALIGLAEIGMKQGMPGITEQYIQQALDIAPKNAVIHQVRGRHLTQQGRLDEAEAAYQQAIELEPKLLRLRLEVGDFYLQQVRQTQKAIQSFEAALELNASHAGAHFGLGSALAKTGQIDRAVQEFEKAGRIAPNNPLPFFALGRIHAVQEQYDQASQAFGKAIQAQPKFAQAYIGRGDVYTIQKEDASALQDYEAARDLAPGIAGLHVKIGLLHERNHRFDQAVDSFRTAISLDPRQAIAFNNLAWISVQHNTRLEEALTWAEQAVALAPKISAFQDTLGWVHRKRGNLDKAADILKKASTLKPEQADIFYHLGVVEDERGKTQKAVRALEKALSLDSTFPNAEDARRRLRSLENH